MIHLIEHTIDETLLSFLLGRLVLGIIRIIQLPLLLCSLSELKTLKNEEHFGKIRKAYSVYDNLTQAIQGDDPSPRFESIHSFI